VHPSNFSARRFSTRALSDDDNKNEKDKYGARALRLYFPPPRVTF
jgi:hypothetical protein